MTDSQQNDAFDMSEIAALAAAKFGGVEYQQDDQKEEDNATSVSSESVENKAEPVETAPETKVDDAAAESNNVAEATEKTAEEVKQPEIDPLLKALLEQNQPKQEEKQEPAQEVNQEAQTEPAQQEQPQPQNKVYQPNDLIDDATRALLTEYRDLDEQSFTVMDQVAAAHARANALNLENAMVQVVQQMQAQLAQQNQVIRQLQSQLSGVNTRITAPTLDQDIEAMKSDPAVAAYLPYMQNVLNGNDSNAKMQLVNTWKQSKSQAPVVAPAVQAPVIERRTSNVSAAAEATAALANKTQSSMVQPQDEIKEGMDLAAARFGPNR